MCRNIKTLFNFEPPVTDAEIRAASVQFVRKLSGFTKPSKANEAAFERAVDRTADVAHDLLRALVHDGVSSRSRGRGGEGSPPGRRAVSQAREPACVSERVLQNRDRYNRMARAYEALVRFGSFGQFGRFYRAVAAEIDACPGGTILDLGCGLGTLVPHLLPSVAPGGTVIGVDIADQLIERARALAAREGWRNVELARVRIRRFHLGVYTLVSGRKR